MEERRITQIWIYPVKSLAGVRLTEARVMPKGLAHDRRWMLVDGEGRFLTQREHPEMALLRVTLQGSRVTVMGRKRADTITLDLTGAAQGDVLKVQIWDDEVEAVEVSPEFSKWFSDELGMDCRLVFFPEPNRRDVDPDYANRGEQVSLADGYPFLIIGQASLDLLNAKLPEALPMRRFRPNFVFSGSHPHEEDAWKLVKIGGVGFEGKKKCGRCVLTTVDPETGTKGPEPLKTLATYRKENNGIYFGENLVALEEGWVREGDKVTVLELKTTLPV